MCEVCGVLQIWFYGGAGLHVQVRQLEKIQQFQEITEIANLGFWFV
jgi:hypothetical protein